MYISLSIYIYIYIHIYIYPPPVVRNPLLRNKGLGQILQNLFLSLRNEGLPIFFRFLVFSTFSYQNRESGPQ